MDSSRLAKPVVTRWHDKAPPAERELLRLLEAESLQAYSWSNSPGDSYSAHSHPYNKVIFVVSGSITFGLPELGYSIVVQAGDRLDLPAGLTHDATVGTTGVTCLEAHR